MSVHIDCDTCVVRGLACHDCVVTVLLGPAARARLRRRRAAGARRAGRSPGWCHRCGWCPGVRPGRGVGVTGAPRGAV